MKIAIDARAFGWTGIGRYTRNLLTQYAAMSSSHHFLVLVPKGKKEGFSKLLKLPEDKFELVEVEGSYYSWREQVFYWQQLEKIEADIFHFTHFNVPVFFRKPYVVTIHDTTRFIFPGERRQHLLQQIAYEVVFAQAVKKAKGIISVSQATKRDLEELPISLPVTPQVIHEGVEEEFLRPLDPALAQKANLLLGGIKNYLLYVGVWMNHKNLRRLLEAFAIVRKTYPDLKLIMTGQPVPAYSPVLKEAERLKVTDSILFPGFVPYDVLPAVFANSAAFVFPSLYEGFGLPPLEAAACGVPVITSNVSSLPEVMGQAAHYVNPEDERDIARGIIRVLADRSYRESLVRAGKERAREFSWQTCAQATVELYQKLG
jgi:glycosyltransferase involved in cell wall biosynthesis